MRKFLTLFAALLALPGFAHAEPGELSGELTIAHGWSKDAAGNNVNLAGRKVQYRAFPIKARKLDDPVHYKNQTYFNPASKFRSIIQSQNNFNGPSFLNADTVVYDANAGSGYGYVESNPSSLDDISMTSAAINKPWSTMKFGMQYNASSFSNFIIRWRCYTTNTENAAPNTDFTGEFADFGVLWNQNLATGAYIIEINVNQAAISTSDQTIYIAQQFRAPHIGAGGLEDGEGAFLTGTVETIFNAGGNPSVGSSEDQFWYDSDPAPDGAYENTEIDVFEGSKADHLLVISVASSGSVQTLTPVAANMGIGRFVSGNLLSVLNLDNNNFNIRMAFDVSRTSPVGTINVDFFQTATSISNIRIAGTASVTVANVTQTIELFDFVNGVWKPVSSQLVNSGVNTFNDAYGGSTPLTNFVGTINHPLFGNIPAIRARIAWKNNSFDIPRNWDMKLDQMTCNITTP